MFDGHGVTSVDYADLTQVRVATLGADTVEAMAMAFDPDVSEHASVGFRVPDDAGGPPTLYLRSLWTDVPPTVDRVSRWRIDHYSNPTGDAGLGIVVDGPRRQRSSGAYEHSFVMPNRGVVRTYAVPLDRGVLEPGTVAVLDLRRRAAEAADTLPVDALVVMAWLEWGVAR